MMAFSPCLKVELMQVTKALAVTMRSVSFVPLLAVLLAYNFFIGPCNASEEPETSSSGAMSLMLMPRERVCFHDFMKEGEKMRASYEVLRGGAQLDINFQIMDESDAIIVSDSKKSSSRFYFTPQKSGDFKICLDNSFSTFSSKVVYFDYYSTEQMERLTKHERNKNPKEQLKKITVAEEELKDLDVQVEQMDSALLHIKKNLRGSAYNQGQFRNLEYRDRKLAERTYDLVNRASLFSVLAILCTGICQVMMIRILFSSKGSPSKGFKFGL